MSSFPFIGASYTARSKSFDSQRCVNLYPEMSGSGTSKNIAALYGTPGLVLWAALAGGGVRGALRFSAALSVWVIGTNVYRVSTGGAAVLIGTIPIATMPVSLATNGTDNVMMVTGPEGYVIGVEAGTLTKISDVAFTGADKVDFLDGYYVFNKSGTGQFQITQLYGTTIDPLDFATAEGSPDKLISLIVDHRELWLFGENSTEVFFNSGNSDFPFERIQGAFIEQGCAAKFSVAKMDNSVFWLSADDRGQGIVQRASGYQPQRISTHAVEYAIAQYARIDDAVAYTYQQEGHQFYVLSFPSANATWVFDASTNLWHERAWRDPADNSLNRHRSNCHIAFAGENLVGDWQNGNIYKLDLDTFNDNGNPLPAIRQAPHIANGNLLQFYHRLWVDMEVGVGIVSGAGSDPKAMLQWSDDGGYTWSNELWVSMGKLGERKVRAMWRRLGKSRDRVFRVIITDPVKRCFINGDIEVTPGTS
jgi:hypothetical protein